MIKAVVFDMYSTLVTLFGVGCEHYFSGDMARDAGVTPEEFRKVWRKTEQARTCGEITSKEALADTLKELGRYSDELLEKIYQKRVDSKSRAFQQEYIYPEIFKMLDGLKEKGIKIGLISNCFSEEAVQIRESALFPYFDVAMLSYEQHVCKPDKEIFARCLTALGLEAKECLYVGDGGSEELETAGEVGMHPVQATWYADGVSEGYIDRKPGYTKAEKPMDVVRLVDEGDEVYYASWYVEVPKGDFVSTAPTYEAGKYFSLFHEGKFTYGDMTMRYYWYDPREHGFEDDGKLSMISFLHGTSNALVGELCINYTGAEFYASESYQKTLGGAFLLVPIANEWRDEEGRTQGYWSKAYLEPVHAMILDFIASKTQGVGLKVLLGNSSGATFVLRLMDQYMDDFDVVIPVGSTALPDDLGLDLYDAKGKTLFFALGKRDEFHHYEEEIVPRLPRLQRMKHCFIYTPEWVRNGDKGIASICAGVEMGQHCLVNAMHCNLMFDDGTPMESRLPKGVTGWIADQKNHRPTVVYHGSQYLFDVVKPMQAHGQCDAEAQTGIYAAATMEEVIPFAMPFRWYPDSPEGKLRFDSDGIKSFLQYGSIDPNGKGYIYVLPADTFELVDQWEWVSKVEVKPIEVIEVNVKDYWHTITFSEEAKEIQRKLYGEDSINS